MAKMRFSRTFVGAISASIIATFFGGILLDAFVRQYYGWGPSIGAVTTEVASDATVSDHIQDVEPRTEVQIDARVKLQPKEILDFVGIDYFDASAGSAKVWYLRDTDGRIRLFDAAGFDPVSGRALLPITSEIVFTAETQFEADRLSSQRQAEQANAAAAVEAEAQRRQNNLRELQLVFEPKTYAPGIVLLGGSGPKDDEISSKAATVLLDAAAAALRNLGVPTDWLKPAVYTSGNFDRLANGDGDALVELGLADRLRSAVFLFVDAQCQSDRGMSDFGLSSCTISAKARVYLPPGNHSVIREFSETGAGTTTDRALARAAELILDRHPEFLAEI